MSLLSELKEVAQSQREISVRISMGRDKGFLFRSVEDAQGKLVFSISKITQLWREKNKGTFNLDEIVSVHEDDVFQMNLFDRKEVFESTSGNEMIQYHQALLVAYSLKGYLMGYRKVGSSVSMSDSIIYPTIELEYINPKNIQLNMN